MMLLLHDPSLLAARSGLQPLLETDPLDPESDFLKVPWRGLLGMVSAFTGVRRFFGGHVLLGLRGEQVYRTRGVNDSDLRILFNGTRAPRIFVGGSGSGYFLELRLLKWDIVEIEAFDENRTLIWSFVGNATLTRIHGVRDYARGHAPQPCQYIRNNS